MQLNDTLRLRNCFNRCPSLSHSPSSCAYAHLALAFNSIPLSFPLSPALSDLLAHVIADWGQVEVPFCGYSFTLFLSDTSTSSASYSLSREKCASHLFLRSFFVCLLRANFCRLARGLLLFNFVLSQKSLSFT